MKDLLNSTICAAYLRALAEPARLRIVECLQDGPRTVSAIADQVGGGVARASHHLHVLLRAGLVLARRDGRFIEYALAPELLVRGAGKRPVSLEFGCCRIELGPRRARH